MAPGTAARPSSAARLASPLRQLSVTATPTCPAGAGHLGNANRFHWLRCWFYWLLQNFFCCSKFFPPPSGIPLKSTSFLQTPPKPASKPVDMTNEISALWEFLERCGPEVYGHSLQGLQAEQIAMIERFIAGKCDDVERRELSEFLQLHPAWIRWIADRIKMARELADKPASSGSDKERMSA
jgi:hypothetical protein